MVRRDRRVYMASVYLVLVILEGLGGCWVVMPDHGVYLTSVKAIWVVFGGLGGRSMFMLASRLFCRRFGWC